MAERRDSPRIPAGGLVAIKLVTSPNAPDLEKSELHGRVRDVSANGLQMRVYLEVPVGTAVDVRYRPLDARQVFRRRGRVVWSKAAAEDIVVSYSLGVQLTKLEGTHRTDWQHLLARKEKSSWVAATPGSLSPARPY